MAVPDKTPEAGTTQDEFEARPTPDITERPVVDVDTAIYIKQLEARVALAEASLTIHKALVEALRPETTSFMKILEKIRGRNTGLANNLKLNHKMLNAMAASHPMFKIDTLYGSQRKGEELAEQIREVYALITLLLDTMMTDDAKQVKELLTETLATTSTWENANRVVFNKCKNSQGLPGLYRLVGRLCQGAGLQEKEIEVHQYVRVAAVTAVAVLLTKA